MMPYQLRPTIPSLTEVMDLAKRLPIPSEVVPRVKVARPLPQEVAVKFEHAASPPDFALPEYLEFEVIESEGVLRWAWLFQGQRALIVG